MENLSEYIPLLIIIASVIISSVSGAKKKKKGEISHETRIPGIPSVEYPTIEREPYQPEVSYSEPPRISNSTPESPRVDPRIYNRQNFRATSSQENDKPLVLEEEYTAPFIDTSDLDEVKKAVIYTEIFTRKEY